MNVTEILNQLTQAPNGMNRLIIMIGAKHFVKSEEENYVAFKFMKGAKNKANYIKITLNSMDTYDVEFGKILGMDYKVMSEIDGLYNDQLFGYFQSETGLALKL